MSPELQKEVDAFFEKQAALTPQQLRAAGKVLTSRAALGTAGLVGGASGMYGLRELGQDRLRARREAQELRQLLAMNPELLNAPLYGDDPYATQMPQQDMYGGGGGYGY